MADRHYKSINKFLRIRRPLHTIESCLHGANGNHGGVDEIGVPIAKNLIIKSNEILM